MNRISSQMNSADVQYYLRKQEVKQNILNRQIGSQSRIGSLRDDPIAAGHLVRYQSYISRVNQFEKNAQTLSDQFKVREGYVNQNLQILQRVREIAVSGANGINSRDDLKNMAAEVNELLKELVQNANAVGPDGDSLFAGTRSKSLAFDVNMGNVPGANEPLIAEVRYNGNVTKNRVEVDENQFLDVDNSGNKTFWAEPQRLMGRRDLTQWQAKADNVVNVDGIDIKVNAGDNIYAVIAKINDSGAAVKASLDPVSRGLNLETTDAHQIWLQDREGSTFEELGFIKDKSQLPPYNLTGNVSVSGGSVFDTVIALRDSMLKGDTDAIGTRVLGSIDQGISNMTTRLAKAGSDYERAQNNVMRSQTTALNVTQLVSREGDIDITDALIDIKTLENINQATLSTAGKMYSSTLLNYIR
ncbi:MAG TPA: flagellar hook-associated protein 3 [Treponema sp.]|nr:flagellar hook-associated protein 3 [Treponema sp.]